MMPYRVAQQALGIEQIREKNSLTPKRRQYFYSCIASYKCLMSTTSEYCDILFSNKAYSVRVNLCGYKP